QRAEVGRVAEHLADLNSHEVQQFRHDRRLVKHLVLEHGEAVAAEVAAGALHAAGHRRHGITSKVIAIATADCFQQKVQLQIWRYSIHGLPWHPDANEREKLVDVQGLG